MSALGKKAQDRNWKNYYAVLADTTITFYKDRKEAVLVSSPSPHPNTFKHTLHGWMSPAYADYALLLLTAATPM